MHSFLLWIAGFHGCMAALNLMGVVVHDNIGKRVQAFVGAMVCGTFAAFAIGYLVGGV